MGRQPAAELGDLGHVVHQHRAGSAPSVLTDVDVVVETVEAKRAQLASAPSDPGADLHRGPDGGSRLSLEHLQALGAEQLGHHHLGQRETDLVIPAVVGPVVGEREREQQGGQCREAASEHDESRPVTPVEHRHGATQATPHQGREDKGRQKACSKATIAGAGARTTGCTALWLPSKQLRSIPAGSAPQRGSTGAFRWFRALRKVRFVS